jgi:hypothetical protein
LDLCLRVADRVQPYWVRYEAVPVPVGQTLWVGREQGSDIYLPWPTVSLRHCQIHRDEGGVRVVDTNSLNGTLLNDARLPSFLPVYLRPCDVIQVTDSEIRLEGRATIDRAWLAWNDGTVRKMALGIRERGRYGDLPILHDALLDAGCDNEEILDHCRGAGRHFRGCWVLDLLLGKE